MMHRSFEREIDLKLHCANINMVAKEGTIQLHLNQSVCVSTIFLHCFGKPPTLAGNATAT